MSERDSWRWNTGVLWGGQFVVTAGLVLLVPLLPFYLEEIGLSEPRAIRFWSGLALAAPALTLTVGAPLWGRVGDRWGRKWMVVRALAGIAVSLLLMALARTPLQFLLCRLLQGACGGVVDSAAAFASAEIPADQRGRVLGKLQSATAAGALVGPLMGGVLADRWGFRPLLAAAGLLAGLVALAATWLLREGGAGGPHPAREQSLGRTIQGLCQAGNARSFLLAALCTQAGAYGLVTVFAPHVRALLPDDAGAATWVGLLQAVSWGATALGGFWWGRRNDRVPIEQNFFLAALGCGLAVLLQGVAGEIGWLVPLRLLQGFCTGAFTASIYLYVSRAARPGQQGLYIGVANSCLTGGQILGALLGALLGGLLEASWIFFVMAALFCMAALLVRPQEVAIRSILYTLKVRKAR